MLCNKVEVVRCVGNVFTLCSQLWYSGNCEHFITAPENWGYDMKDKFMKGSIPMEMTLSSRSHPRSRMLWRVVSLGLM